MVVSKVSVNPVLSQQLAQQIVEALGDINPLPANSLMDVWQIGLFTAGPSPANMDHVVGDFTPAAFTGYAPTVPATVSAPTRCSDNDGMEVFADVMFQMANPAIPETILGYFCVDGAASTLMMYEYFDAPVPIVNVGDAINLKVILPIRSPALA